MTRSIGFARGTLEVDYWIKIHGCPNCGERDIGEPRLRIYGQLVEPEGSFPGGVFDVTCPRCGHHREVKYFEIEGVERPRVGLELGGASPSQIISAQEFAIEMQRSLALVPPEFEHLSDQEQHRINEERAHARVSAVELLKFIPAGLDEIPDDAFGEDVAYKREHQTELTRSYLESKAKYLTDYLARMREASKRAEVRSTEKRRLPVPAFSLASLKLHEQWVREGDVGENQQLIARGADATEMKLSARNLSNADMDKVTLDRADLSYAFLDRARLVQVSLRGASLENASAVEATFLTCHFEGIDAFLFKLRATQFDRCDFTGANLMRSVWTQCVTTNSIFTGADLRNARLDEARFIDCDLRDADLSVPEPGVNTARGARFTRCDLRGTKWDGRDLEGVEFSSCNLEGSGLERRSAT